MNAPDLGLGHAHAALVGIVAHLAIYGAVFVGLVVAALLTEPRSRRSPRRRRRPEYWPVDKA